MWKLEFGAYFVYNQGHLIAWREKEVEPFIGSGLVVFVLFSFGLVITSWWLLFAVSFTEEEDMNVWFYTIA